MQPADITYHRDARILTLRYDDGQSLSISAHRLRVMSPSAEVVGHDGVRRDVLGKENVTITAIEPVGRYAIRLVFDDSHSTGIYTWAYLRELGLGERAVPVDN